MDGQISQPVACDSPNNMQDQYQQPPFTPPCKDTFHLIFNLLAMELR